MRPRAATQGPATAGALRDTPVGGRYPSRMTNARRRASMTVRKARLGDDDGRFDSEFWARQTPEARLEAVWQAVLDWAALNGIDEGELRVQRSVVRVERR